MKHLKKTKKKQTQTQNNQALRKTKCQKVMEIFKLFGQKYKSKLARVCLKHSKQSIQTTKGNKYAREQELNPGLWEDEQPLIFSFSSSFLSRFPAAHASSFPTTNDRIPLLHYNLTTQSGTHKTGPSYNTVFTFCIPVQNTFQCCCCSVNLFSSVHSLSPVIQIRRGKIIKNLFLPCPPDLLLCSTSVAR